MKKQNRLPLVRDEKLWDAFKEDRDAAERKRTKREYTKRPDNCQGPCGRKFRPTRALLENYPDTVRHRSHGICEACATKSKVQ